MTAVLTDVFSDAPIRGDSAEADEGHDASSVDAALESVVSDHKDD